MSDIIQQIEAAAALGEKATERPWRAETENELNHTIRGTVPPQCFKMDDLVGDRIHPIDAAYIVAAANLPLSAIAEELRAKDAEIERLRAFVRGVLTHDPSMCECEGLGPRDCLDMIIQDAKALDAKESAND